MRTLLMWWLNKLEGRLFKASWVYIIFFRVYSSKTVWMGLMDIVGLQTQKGICLGWSSRGDLYLITWQSFEILVFLFERLNSLVTEIKLSFTLHIIDPPRSDKNWKLTNIHSLCLCCLSPKRPEFDDAQKSIEDITNSIFPNGPTFFLCPSLFFLFLF